MKYTHLILMAVLWSLSTHAFQLPFRPLEQIRYRSGACEMDLERTSFALLKEKTYEGCLQRALEALYRKGSRLSRQFERTYNLKNRQYEANYDADMKGLVAREIKYRLNLQEFDANLFDKLSAPTEETRQEFQRYLHRFCQHAKVLDSSYGRERAERIMSGLENLDVRKMFSGFRRTLRVAEALDHKEPQILKGLKQLRGRFLTVMNQMVILKKALSGKKLREGVEVDDIMRQVTFRTEWINAYHLLKIHALMSDACQQDKRVCEEAFEEMDWLASVIQSFDDLQKVCWVRSRRVV